MLATCLVPLMVRGAAAPDASESETNLIPKDVQLWTESMLWDEQVNVSSGVGYKDNVLLSAFNPRGSAFAVNGLDLMVLRLPMDGWKVVGAIVGDDTRYWHDVGVDREDSWISSLRVERELPAGWLAGLEARGLYEHEVLNVTTPEGSPTNDLVDGYGITVQPSIRKDLFTDGWLKIEFPATRWLFQAPLDNYWELGPVATAGYNFGKRAYVTASYGANWQKHDQWLNSDEFGLRAVPPLLEIFQQQAELAWHQYWDARRRWHSSTRAIFTDKQDNGSGYFNYHQFQAIEELSWQNEDWMIKVGAQIAYSDYPVQTTYELGPLLYQNLWDLSLEMERRIGKSLKGFAKLEYQRELSNESDSNKQYGVDDFQATTVSGGLRLEF
jgi:hypothetical protein